MTIPIDVDLYVGGIPIYWTHQLENLALHVDKRGLEPYARYTLTHWSRP